MHTATNKIYYLGNKLFNASCYGNVSCRRTVNPLTVYMTGGSVEGFNSLRSHQFKI